MIGFERHPRGLAPLFFTEMWERFSFYGLNAILVLYLVLPLEHGGLGYAIAHAATVYGNYVLSVYLCSILGGWLADRVLGAGGAVLLGGVVIACGHFLLAIDPGALLVPGLACVALGTGLLKPNISALVGRLYAAGDERRDAGFSLFYMGINLGAFAAPLACGFLAQSEAFGGWLLRQAGLDPRLSWHWGFGAAGVGMLFGLAVFARYWWWRGGRELLGTPLPGPAPATATATAQAPPPGLPPRGEMLQRLAAIGYFCVGAILFSIVLKQSGASLALFADRLTRNEIFGWAFPSSWYQSVGPALVMLLAPCFSWLWLRLGERQPSSPYKVVIGAALGVLAFVVLVFAAQAAVSGRVSPLWLLGVYFVTTLSELCISPVGLSNVTRLAPQALIGVMMGAWFVAIGLGGKLAGVFASWMDLDAVDGLSGVFVQQALIIAAGGAALALLAPWVRRVVVRSGMQ